MDVQELVATLASRGIRIAPDPTGEKLTVEPASRLTDADRAAIKQAKPELLRLLRKDTPTPPRAQPMTWTQDEGAALITTVMARCAYQRDQRADAVSRPRIAKLMQDFEPMIAYLFEQADYESLRFCLIDLERNIGGTLSGREWN